MINKYCLYVIFLFTITTSPKCSRSSANSESVVVNQDNLNPYYTPLHQQQEQQQPHNKHQTKQSQHQSPGQNHQTQSQIPHGHVSSSSVIVASSVGVQAQQALAHHLTAHAGSGQQHLEHQRSSYNLLSEAMSQAVSNEFSALGSGSADGACHSDDLDCYSGNVQDRLGMEAIRTLHRQLDDDDNGNIDLSESDDFLREELKYDSGYEKRQKAFHFNDDMHISVKELWEAWLRSEVHNWTIEQTTDWLSQSVQLPQYVELFKLHKVTGASLPRLAVNNMHYVSNVLGIKDPIHKQKISLKAMDVVLFGPPRETGTRWKDYILVTLLLSAIIGCWYAYQQNKNAKRHLRRMAQDMEGLQRAEQSLQEMQKELERARMEQENVATEKMDLERRLKEAPALSSSSSDLEVQQLKKEIEMLRTELSRAEIELVDNCWAPPPQLQSWLQYTYELENKNHQKKRVSAEKQLQSAREACEKLRKKRSSLVGAFVSTHGKSIDDVDRSIVEARNALGEVTNELQERLHRWKQIETCLGLNIVNNNGLPYLESILYGRNGGVATSSTKGSRARITSSTDDLDDESVQGIFDNFSRTSTTGGGLNSGGVGCSSGSVVGNSLLMSNSNTIRDDSSCSDDGLDNQSVQFYLGHAPTPPIVLERSGVRAPLPALDTATVFNHNGNNLTTIIPSNAPPLTLSMMKSASGNDSFVNDCLDGGSDSRHSPSVSSSERSIPVPPRLKKHQQTLLLSVAHTQSPPPPPPLCLPIGRAPLPPPRKSNQSLMLRSQSTDLVPMEIYTSYHHYNSNSIKAQQPTTTTAVKVGGNLTGFTGSIVNSSAQQYLLSGLGIEQQTAGSTGTTTVGHVGNNKKIVKQHSTASQQSTSSTSSSVQSAPPTADYRYCVPGRGNSSGGSGNQSPARWSSHERVASLQSLYGSGVAIGSHNSLGFLHHHQPQLPPTHFSNSFTPASTSTSTVVATHGDIELNFKTGKPVQNHLLNKTQCITAHADDDSRSTSNETNASSNIGNDSTLRENTAETTVVDTKKRKRRLRFPFGNNNNAGGAGNNGRKINSSNKNGKTGNQT